MQELLKHLPAVIYEYAIHPDGDKHFRFISENCESILGLRQEAFLKDPLILDTIIHSDDLPLLKDAVAERQEAEAEWLWQGRVHVHGQIKWMEFRSTHQKNEDGSILRRGVIQDITSRKESLKES